MFFITIGALVSILLLLNFIWTFYISHSDVRYDVKMKLIKFSNRISNALNICVVVTSALIMFN